MSSNKYIDYFELFAKWVIAYGPVKHRKRHGDYATVVAAPKPGEKTRKMV